MKTKQLLLLILNSEYHIFNNEPDLIIWLGESHISDYTINIQKGELNYFYNFSSKKETAQLFYVNSHL